MGTRWLLEFGSYLPRPRSPRWPCSSNPETIEDSDDTVDRRPGGLAGSAPYRRIAPRRAGVRPAGSHGSRPGCDIEIAPDKP